MVLITGNALGSGLILDTWTPRPLCKKDCGSMDGNRHKETAQRAPQWEKGKLERRLHLVQTEGFV